MSLPYRDRVVQHSLCDNCASRPGKGTHYGLFRLATFMREFYHQRGTEGYILKADISKYFYSIRHDKLKEMLYPRIADEGVKWLLDMIIDSTPGNVGLPIGNMTSQWFAIYYLNGMDRLIKEQLKIRWYVRYMDDFLLIHESKDYLRECLANIREHLSGLGLQLNNKTQIFPIRNGVDFLGFHSYLTETGKVVRKIRDSSKKRMKRKIRAFKRKFASDEMSFDDIKRSLQSWLAHAEHGHTYRLRQRIIGRCVFTKGLKKQ